MTITIPVEKIRPWVHARLNSILPFMKRILFEMLSKPVRLSIALLVGMGMGFGFGLQACVIWFLFTLFLIYEWKSRVFGIIAMICLVVSPILLVLKRNELAEQVAVYAYFFLVMTVALQLVEYKRHPERFQEDKETEDRNA